MSIGARIRQARQHTNLSLDVLAHRAGMSKNGLALIETGKSDPHYSTLKEIARALNIEVAELLEEPALAGKAEAPQEGAGPATTTETAEEEQRRLVGYVRPWLLLLDSYSERWEKAAKEGSFSMDTFMEFSATTSDILKSVNWLLESLQRVQGIDPMAGPIGFTFRESLLRMTNMMGLVSEAALRIFGGNELSEARKKRAEINSAREGLAKRIAT